jgi:PAS domain S-box-containing protein
LGLQALDCGDDLMETDVCTSNVPYGKSDETPNGSSLHALHGRTAATSCSHSVQFYEDDAIFIDGLSEFVGSALGTGGACVVIATKGHRERLAARLGEWGIDLSVAANSLRYLSLDAQATLAKFMVEGWPNEERFWSVIEPVLLQARVGLGRKTGPVVAFGEMVALLWAEGKCEAAIRLEQLWNELAGRHAFSLRCAYPMGCFGEAHGDLFRQICAEHTAVIPTENYTSLKNEDERLLMVSVLQQKAQTLQAAVLDRQREMAQRKRTEEDLRRTEEFARKVVESSVDCVKVLDLEGRLEYMSPPGQKALEIADVNEVLGRRWVDFWNEEDRTRAEAALVEAKAGGVGNFRGDCLTQSGHTKSWDVKITPALDSNGILERFIVVSRDITELKQAQLVTLQAEKLAATGRFAATMAHEINNPLEAVMNFIYLAKTSEGVPEGVCRQLEIADRELARVAQIAQQTLGFYRDISQRKWVSPSALIRDVLALYEPRLRYKRLKTEIMVDADLKVNTKQGELKQVLSNLLTNAIDASNPDGTLWLRVHPTRNCTNGMERGVRITLADNGSGMTSETKNRIFVPFFTTKPDVGTGIGLWVTKNLIENQGGYMRFRSRQGSSAGTVMSFFLPFTHDQPPEAFGIHG